MMDAKVSNQLIKRASCQVKQPERVGTKKKPVIDTGKKSKTPNEVEPVEKTNKNSRFSQDKSPTPTIHVIEKILLYLRKITSHREIAKINLSHPSLSHIKQECQESQIQ